MIFPMIAEAESLKGRVVLITGGTTGIGRATAVLLGARGARIFIFGRHKRELNDALRDIRKNGGEAHGMIADVTEKDQVEGVFSALDKQFGTLDVLVNNAGLPARSILESEYDDWLYVIETNLVGYLHCARLAIERMLPKRSGHIVNIGSMSAITRDAESDLYVATKSGVQGFNESLRKLVNPKCIKVTLIEPGSVGTELTGLNPEEQDEREEKEVMLKAEDVARCILFVLIQPKRSDIITIQVRPHKQII